MHSQGSFDMAKTRTELDAGLNALAVWMPPCWLRLGTRVSWTRSRVVQSLQHGQAMADACTSVCIASSWSAA